MARWQLLLVLGAMSCTHRPLEIPEDGGTKDLSVQRDSGVDLAVPRDLAGADFSGVKPDPCPAGTQFIFTIDENTTLSRFNPLVAQFFDVGPINCPSNGDTPNSMAIDRNGNGWVNYQQGGLFRLLTDTATCTSTPYVVGQHGFSAFGMSFAEDTPGSKEETLYVTPTANAQARLSSIDLTTFVVSDPIVISTIGNGELSGDDQGNLWGFFPDVSTPFVARIDRGTGQLDRFFMMPQLAGQSLAWGFAAWQNDFYIFLQRDIDNSTVIYKLEGSTGSVTTIIADTGRKIVGVGVATCAGNGLDQ